MTQEKMSKCQNIILADSNRGYRLQEAAFKV